MAVAISVTGLSKTYDGVMALRGVSADIIGGLVTAVVGENGAGKSTLLSLMAGLQRPDAGLITVRERAVVNATPARMLVQHGIALVPQELDLCLDRSIAENVLLGLEPGLLPRRRNLHRRSSELLQRVGLPDRPDAIVSSLPAAHRQLVLVARALARGCSIVILDEPTAILTAPEAERLHELLRELRTQGVTLVYVSHRLPDVLSLADHVLVLRDGELISTRPNRDLTQEDLVRDMLGHKRAAAPARDQAVAHRTTSPSGSPAPGLTVQGLTTTSVHGVDLEVSSGEVLGLAGLPDCGRHELLEALFAARPFKGRVSVAGQPQQLRKPSDAIRAGVALIPGERRTAGILADMSVTDNLVVALTRRDPCAVFTSRRHRKRLAKPLAEDCGVRGRLGQPMRTLSGGNQQKAILGRWEALKPRVLLLDEPTRGIDIAARDEVHRRVRAAAIDGAAVILSSSDVAELLAVCDRIGVMRHGHLVKVVRVHGDDLDVMAAALSDTVQLETEPASR